MSGAWTLAFLRALVAVASYALGVGLSVFPQMALRLHLLLGAGVGILTLSIEYFTNIRPTRHWQEVAPFIVDEITAPFLDFLKEQQLTPRLNVMVPRRTWRGAWVRRYFTIWWARGMENQPDVNITFPVGQGATGECFRRKAPIYAPPVALGTGYHFPRSLLPLVKDIEAIICYPIYEPPRGGRQSGRLIGVLTLDSKTPGAYSLLTSDKLRPIVHERMEKIAIFVSRISP